MWVGSLSGEDPLEEETAINSVFLPGNFHGRGAWPATVQGGLKESNMTEQTDRQTICLLILGQCDLFK